VVFLWDPEKGEKTKKKGRPFSFLFQSISFSQFFVFFLSGERNFCVCPISFFWLPKEKNELCLFVVFGKVKKNCEGSHDAQTKLGFSRKEESWQKNAKTNCFLVFRKFLGRRAK